MFDDYFFAMCSPNVFEIDLTSAVFFVDPSLVAITSSITPKLFASSAVKYVSLQIARNHRHIIKVNLIVVQKLTSRLLPVHSLLDDTNICASVKLI